MRPNAQTWQAALKEAENALVTCSVNNQHRYGNHLNICPWCERTVRLGGRDPFPSWQAVQKRQHLQPLPRKRVTHYRSDRTVAPISSIATRQTSLLLTLPRQQRKRIKKKFNPLVLGLFGVGVLGLLEIMVIVNDIKLPPDSGFTIFPTNNPEPPQLPNNGGEGFVAYYNQGNTYYQLGDYEGAIEKFSQALRLNPQDSQAYVNRGNARHEIAQLSGDPDSFYKAAIEDFNQALRISPGEAQAYLSRGIVRYEIAQYSKTLIKTISKRLKILIKQCASVPRRLKLMLSVGLFAISWHSTAEILMLAIKQRLTTSTQHWVSIPTRLKLTLSVELFAMSWFNTVEALRKITG